MSFWKNFSSGDRFKFRSPGDTIEGEVLRLSATDFGGTGELTPVVTLLTNDGEKEVTASQTVLVSRLAEQAPEVGDWVRITYDGDADNARPGRSPAKLFTVTVKREAVAGKTTTPPAAATTTSAPPQTPEAWKGSDEPF